MHRGFEGGAQLCWSYFDAAGLFVVPPCSRPVPNRRPNATVQIMARRKYFDVAADSNQRLQLRSHVQTPLLVVTHVQRADTDRISSDQVALRVPVPECKGEDAIKPVEEFEPFLGSECYDQL